MLEHISDGRRLSLSNRCLVGRATHCELRLNDRRVSGEHGSIFWRRGQWFVRDLASRNGTTINGRQVDPTDDAELPLGAEVCFGDSGEVWRLIDASEPGPVALQLSTGALRTTTDGLMVLPDTDRPLVSMFQMPAGGWGLEVGERNTAVTAENGAVIDVEGDHWMLLLPPDDSDGLATTWSGATATSLLQEIGLRFAVSPDEEHVDVYIERRGSESERLPARAHHYMLLTLARARIRDQTQGLSEDAAGWVHVEDLCAMLTTDAQKLNVDVFRARRQVGEFRVLGAAGVIERRGAARQLRLGIAQLTVDTL